MSRKINKRKLVKVAETSVLFLPQLVVGYLSFNYFYVFINYISPKLLELYGNAYYGANQYTNVTIGNLVISAFYIGYVLYTVKQGKKVSPLIQAAVFSFQLFLFYITSLLHGLLVVRIVAVSQMAQKIKEGFLDVPVRSLWACPGEGKPGGLIPAHTILYRTRAPARLGTERPCPKHPGRRARLIQILNQVTVLSE